MAALSCFSGFTKGCVSSSHVHSNEFVHAMHSGKWSWYILGKEQNESVHRISDFVYNAIMIIARNWKVMKAWTWAKNCNLNEQLQLNGDIQERARNRIWPIFAVGKLCVSMNGCRSNRYHNLYTFLLTVLHVVLWPLLHLPQCQLEWYY